MKNLKESKFRTLRNFGIITFIFGGLSLYSFNCAPPSFQIADNGSLQMSSTGDIVPVDSSGVLSTTIQAPQALLTSEQVYESLMNLTGQKSTVTSSQLKEFSARSGSLPMEPSLDKINAPMLMALTSFSGEVCNGLVQQEKNLATDQRKFFQSINMGTAISNVTDANYQDALNKMSQAFMGRDLTSDELALFSQFKTDFIAGIPSNQTTSSTQTQYLMMSVCAAMLSSFDVYTY